jgi:hypothetical protein
MGIELNYSTAFHPQTDGQTERVYQVLEDLLRVWVLTYGSNWEKSMSHAEFLYNNNYQASLKMAPFEALYGRKCRTPLMWSEVGERTFFGPATIAEPEENIAKVRENLKIAQSRQKSYADSKRKDISFEVGGHIYLKVSPLQGTKMFHVKGKLSPRYVSPYPIVKKIGKVAYKLELSPELTGVHLVFHVSQLRKCVGIEKRVPSQALVVQETLEYLEYPVWILDWADKSTRSTTMRFCNVLWSNHSEHEATWEKESMREKYPHLFEPEVTS